MIHPPPWTHRLRAFNNGDIPAEELEALSRRHSSATILLLPLASGRVALFDNARVFRLLCDVADLTYEELTRLSLAWDAELRAETHHVERLRSLGIGEPDVRRQARDIRRQATTRSDFTPTSLDLDSI